MFSDGCDSIWNREFSYVRTLFECIVLDLLDGMSIYLIRNSHVQKQKSAVYRRYLAVLVQNPVSLDIGGFVISAYCAYAIREAVCSFPGVIVF